MNNKSFDFQTAVIQRSHQLPVLVDFWAEWCAPCRQLGPVLESLAGKYEGEWELVKINIEEYPDIATSYGVRSIPDVKLFVNGAVYDEFSGALSESQVEAWLKKVMPSPYSALLDSAAKAIAEGDSMKAVTLLEGVLHHEPHNSSAKAMLARQLLFTRTQEAAMLAESLEGEPEYTELSESVTAIANLLQRSGEDFPEDPVRERYAEAVASLLSRDFDSALAAFIDVLRQNRYYDDDNSRKICIAIFKYLGEEHEITLKYRRTFDRAF